MPLVEAAPSQKSHSLPQPTKEAPSRKPRSRSQSIDDAPIRKPSSRLQSIDKAPIRKPSSRLQSIDGTPIRKRSSKLQSIEATPSQNLSSSPQQQSLSPSLSTYNNPTYYNDTDLGLSESGSTGGEPVRNPSSRLQSTDADSSQKPLPSVEQQSPSPNLPTDNNLLFDEVDLSLPESEPTSPTPTQSRWKGKAVQRSTSVSEATNREDQEDSDLDNQQRDVYSPSLGTSKEESDVQEELEQELGNLGLDNARDIDIALELGLHLLKFHGCSLEDHERYKQRHFNDEQTSQHYSLDEIANLSKDLPDVINNPQITDYSDFAKDEPLQ